MLGQCPLHASEAKGDFAAGIVRLLRRKTSPEGIGFSLERTNSLAGRHVTDQQMRLFMSLRRTHSPAVAGAKAGFSTSAAYRFEKDPRLPTQKKAHRERRRADPFVDVWENEVLPMLKAAPGLRPIAVFEELCRRHPELGSVTRRTLERHVRA